jgi:trans-aconitate methyltransferase
MSKLYDENRAVAFYQERYSHGYMEVWPIEKKRRIFEIVRSLGLPDEGEAIDFGCGNGVLTDVIRQALPPGWKVYGTDISGVAIDNAAKHYPGCIFFVADNGEFTGKRFDFLFTHHVLEHVYNLPQVFDEINGRLKDASTMMHILPCGNAGSLEHSICLLRKDGINPRLENRFFFEDEGHIRRLTTEQLSKLCREKDFVLIKEYYSNQYYGALDWITQSGSSFMRLFTDVSLAVDEEAKNKLERLRYKLIVFWCARYPAVFIESRLHKKAKTFRDYVFLLLSLPLYVFTKPMDSWLKCKALEEWNRKKTERNGSEMYLFFKR